MVSGAPPQPFNTLILGSQSRTEDVIIEMRQEVSDLISIHVDQVFSDGDCPSNASLTPICLFLQYICTLPIDDMVFFNGMVCDGRFPSISLSLLSSSTSKAQSHRHGDHLRPQRFYVIL